MNTYTIYLISLFWLSCSFGSNSTKVIHIADGSKPFDWVYKPEEGHYSWSMHLKNNTLNDTAKVGIVILKPGYNGTLFRTEFFSDDSLHIRYQPYKATSGSVTIICTSSLY
jgi:hypothetical protein